MNGGTISWCCQKQRIVTTSSTDAEYVALSEAVKELIWLTLMSKTFGYNTKQPMTLLTDS
jgi:hypothetical protein